MVRLRLVRLSLTALALVAGRPALAGPINFTGFVENDFPKGADNVRVVNVLSSPEQVGESGFMTQNGWVSGWAIKDVRTSYDANNDTLYVGFNTFKNAAGQPAIVGDADGNGNPGGASPQMTAAGGIDNPNLGGHKAVVVALASDGPNGPNDPGTPLVVAGVPADKSAAGTGIDGFTVAKPKGPSVSLPYNFGGTLTGTDGNPITGQLFADPSAAHPGFEFAIKNFSKIPGIDPFKGFWLSAYAGSPDDVVVGEAGLKFTRVPAFSAQQIPEPSTILAWSLVAGGAALRLRRRMAPRGGSGDEC